VPGPDAAANIIFRREIDLWEKQYQLKVTVDKMQHGAACYNAKEGFITEALKAAPLTNETKVVFVCGPPVMMKLVIDALKGKGFHDDQIFISAERLMYCGLGACCHCMIRGKFTCIDGPVFRYDEIAGYKHD